MNASNVQNAIAAAFVVFVAISAGAAAAPAARPTEQPPRSTDLKEAVEKRLVQIDVGVEGDPVAIRGITANDFVLYVGGQEIQGLIVDRLCGEASVPQDSPAQAEAPVEPQAPKTTPQLTRPRATFIFYFDQPHLTMMGRVGAIDTTRELINRLIVDGSRGSIVSSARRVETIVGMTEDREKLLAGLVRLRADLRQWDSYAATEESRASLTKTCVDAKSYAREEWGEARRSTERLGATVGALAEVPAPKALVYFGDNLRQKAGLHYLQLGCGPDSCEVQAATLIPSAAFEFDAVINEALARGVHFFTIQAEGLLAYRPSWDTWRHRQAQDTLVGLAAETGGEAFLGGASLKFIAGRIAARTSCALLLSFPPGDLPRDKPLPVTLELHVPNVKIQSQGRIVVPSPQSIERARLLAAFTDPASSDDGSLRVLLIPRGGDGKSWHAAVQLRLRPTGIPDTSAELGASIVRQDEVLDQFASSIATRSGIRPIVLEKTVKFLPGAFAVVAVARDTNRGDIASSRLDSSWPDPAKSEAAIAPIAVLQSGAAALSKDGELYSSGSLARDVDEPLDPALAVSVASVVCRGGKVKGPVVVLRWLEDGLANEFLPLTIEEGGDPCVQTVDVVRAGRLRQGVVDYRVVARVGDEIVAQERRTLRVGAPGAAR